MKVETPQILWHNGKDNEQNKNAPVYSISVLESGVKYSGPSSADDFGLVLATAGNHEVNLWKLQLQPSASDTIFSKLDRSTPSEMMKVDLLLTLGRHDSTVNAIKFSPNGLHLATASDAGTILIYSIPPLKRGGGNGRHYWSEINSEKQLSLKVLGGFGGIYDLDWSRDSKRLCVGTLDHTMAIYEDENYNTNQISNSKEKDSTWKCVYRNSMDHNHYIQGVAMDPLQNYVCTMSCDRTVRVYPRKMKKKNRSEENMTEQRLEFGKGKQIKYFNYSVLSEEGPKRSALFAEEASSESFFRRLSWTTDGAYLITPSAIWRKENATCMFRRHTYDAPCRILLGHDKPSRVISSNPILFALPEGKSTHEGLAYKTVFAVLTEKTILIYDTVHSKPLAMARGLHFSGLTDAAWTPDGHSLIVSSSDGYLSVLTFDKGELGNVYKESKRNELENQPNKKARIADSSTDSKNMNMLEGKSIELVDSQSRISTITECVETVPQSKSPSVSETEKTEATVTPEKIVEPNILQPRKKKKRVALTMVSSNQQKDKEIKNASNMEL